MNVSSISLETAITVPESTVAAAQTSTRWKTCQKISGVATLILCTALSAFCAFLMGKSLYTSCSVRSDPLCLPTWAGFQLIFGSILPCGFGVIIAKACHTLDSCDNNRSNV